MVELVCSNEACRYYALPPRANGCRECRMALNLPRAGPDVGWRGTYSRERFKRRVAMIRLGERRRNNRATCRGIKLNGGRCPLNGGKAGFCRHHMPPRESQEFCEARVEGSAA